MTEDALPPPAEGGDEDGDSIGRRADDEELLGQEEGLGGGQGERQRAPELRGAPGGPQDDQQGQGQQGNGGQVGAALGPAAGSDASRDQAAIDGLLALQAVQPGGGLQQGQRQGWPPAISVPYSYSTMETEGGRGEDLEEPVPNPR